MTQPIPLPANGAPNYVSFGYATRDYGAGLALPVSHGSVAQATLVTIPWDVDYYDPAFPDQGRPTGHHDPNGWTVLFGPCTFNGVAFARVMGGAAGDSMHIMGKVAKRISGANVIQRSLEAAEWFVGDHETHAPAADGTPVYSNSHLMVPLVGTLGPDERLQVALDHWNGPAGTDARIVGATVTLHYWPRPWDTVDQGGTA